MMAHWGMLGTALAMAGLGAALGGIGGLLGIGGGLLAIPVLALLFGMEQAMAQGTALVMIVPNVLLAFYRYRQHHAISLRLALGLGALAMLTSYPAARPATSSPDRHGHRWSRQSKTPAPPRPAPGPAPPPDAGQNRAPASAWPPGRRPR